MSKKCIYYIDGNTNKVKMVSGDDFVITERRCVLKPNGDIDYYLDPDDYTKKADGSPATNKDSSSVFEEIAIDGGTKDIYWKVVRDKTSPSPDYEIHVSDTKLDEGYVHFGPTHKIDGSTIALNNMKLMRCYYASKSKDALFRACYSYVNKSKEKGE